MGSSIRFLICSITIVVSIFGLSGLVFAQSSSSSCYADNAGPGCDNAYCEATVCAIDSSCCDTQWDSTCANEAITSCPGNCLTTEGHDAGCSNTACEAAVCGVAASCCNADWDSACVNESISSCGFQTFEVPGSELCWPLVTKNGSVAVNCLGPDLLVPLDVNTPTSNNPPNVAAGPNQSITLPTQLVQLSGSVTDDGMPTPPSLTLLWTLSSGNSGNVTIATPNSQLTDVTISASGVYTFELSADDGELSASDSVQVTVSDPPADLFVNSVGVTDSTPEIGQAFTLSATVRNQGGDASSSSTTLRYRRSINSTITGADTAIGTDFVPILASGGNSPESISVSIGTAGTYWVGACVDSVTGESPTNNQCSAGVQVTVTDPATPADLFVNGVGVTDSTPETGQVFTLGAIVRNQGGDAGSSSTTLRYRRSTNSTITSADTAIGTDFVPILASGGNSPESISVSIGTAGTYWVGACVDSVIGESPTNNQCSAGVQVTVADPATPADLFVNGVGVTDSTPETGQAFTLSATVRNQGGDASSSSTTLRYRRSTNSTITSADTAIGTDFVPILASGGNSPESISLSIGTAGTYWVGACVDSVTGESPTNNQCSAGVQVTVADPTSDLIVTDVAITNPAPQTGQPFNFKATVRNQGAASSSGSTVLRYYRSNDNVITIKDVAVGTDAVPILSAGAASSEDINGSISNAGTYWIGACVDAVGGESPTNNQCSVGVQVTVSGASADLIANSVGVSDTTPETGQAFTLNVTARNQGGAASSSSTTLRYRRSTNSSITTADAAIGTDFVPVLASGGNSPENISVSIGTAGTYWVGACVDAVSGESPTNNQCSAGVQVTVSDPAMPADLIVNTIGVSDSTLETGQAFTLSATVRNQGGSASSGTTTLRYRRSNNSTITTSDTAIGTDSVPILSSGGNSPESVSVSIGTAGTYWVGACVDSVTDESPTNNQCSAGVQVTVSDPATPADLIVNTIGVSDSTPETGQAFTLSATVRNQGGSASSGTTTLRYRRSANSTITTTDTAIGTDSVPILSSGGNSPESVSVSIGTSGTYWVGACVDSVTDESPTNNQCSAGVQVTVSDPATPADLIVNTIGVSDSTPETGQAFTLSATVRNQGGSASSGTTTLRYRRSANSTITTTDTAIGTDSVPILSSGGNSPESVSVSISSPGTYWVGACVDSVTGESPTNNQCSAGVQVTVDCGSGERNVGGVCKIIITNAGQCSNTPTSNNNHDSRPPSCSSCHSDGRVCSVPSGYVYP